METKRDAARQILGHVSDIQAVVGLCGMPSVSEGLAQIRSQAAWIMATDGAVEKILSGYEYEAQAGIQDLVEKIGECGGGLVPMDNAEISEVLLLAEVCVGRLIVCRDRRGRMGAMAGFDALGGL